MKSQSKIIVFIKGVIIEKDIFSLYQRVTIGRVTI